MTKTECIVDQVDPGAGRVGTDRTRQCYLLFAGAHTAPVGGMGDLVGIFTSEEPARAAFRVIRLQTASSRGSWAQLAVVDGENGIKPLCWFGIGATPARMRQPITDDHVGATMPTETIAHQTGDRPDTDPRRRRSVSKKLTALLAPARGRAVLSGVMITRAGAPGPSRRSHPIESWLRRAHPVVPSAGSQAPDIGDSSPDR